MNSVRIGENIVEGRRISFLNLQRSMVDAFKKKENEYIVSYHLNPCHGEHWITYFEMKKNNNNNKKIKNTDKDVPCFFF